MEYFYSGGGNNRPDFTYRFLMRKITDDMYDWCDAYPLVGPFERWHIINNYNYQMPFIQFESRKAAYLFRIAFSEYVIEDKTYSFAQDKDW